MRRQSWLQGIVLALLGVGLGATALALAGRRGDGDAPAVDQTPATAPSDPSFERAGLATPQQLAPPEVSIDEIVQLRRIIDAPSVAMDSVLEPGLFNQGDVADAERLFRSAVAELSGAGDQSSVETTTSPASLDSAAGPTGADARGQSPRVAALRGAAELLDKAAAILEAADEYDRADAVRRSAADLRTGARTFQGENR